MTHMSIFSWTSVFLAASSVTIGLLLQFGTLDLGTVPLRSWRQGWKLAHKPTDVVLVVLQN